MKNRYLIVLLWLLSMTVFAQRPQYAKMSPLLRRLTHSSTSVRRLSLSVQPTSVCAFVKVDDGGDEVLQQKGCQILTRVGQIRIVNIPISQLGALSLDRRILRMEARQGTQLTNDQMAAHLNALPAYAGQNLPQAFSGQGVVVGVMDVGFDLTHPTFFSNDTTQYRIHRLWDMVTQDTIGSQLFVGRDYVGRDALLSLGHSRDGLDLTHGTHTTGTAAGSGWQSAYRGMAPEADICLVANAVVDDYVYIDSADIYKYTFATDALGFKYLFDYANSVGKPCVASFSEGSMQDFWGYDQLYYELLDSLVGPGRIIVSAAGNNAWLKSWFRKPVGQVSMGTFVIHPEQDMLLTFKASRHFRLRFVTYSAQRDTLEVSTSDVLAQPDSVLYVASQSGEQVLSVMTEAYPSCYDSQEVCYDVTLSSSKGVGMECPVSVEVLGREADVECYRMNGQMVANDLNPLLNAGDGSHSILSPSSAPCVICVGATSYRDSIQNLNGEWKKYWPGHGGVRVEPSSVGPTFDGRMKPDVMAPGNNIISSYSSYYMESHPNNRDLTWNVECFDFKGRTYAWNSNSGTSMACPAVAGAIALWLQAKPDLTPDEIKTVLSHTARHYDESLLWPNNEYGYGEIDVYRGLLYILGIDGVPAISQQHTKARVFSSGKQVRIVLPELLSAPLNICIYNMSGHLVKATALDAGQTDYAVPVSYLPSGIYAVQINGSSKYGGSTLIKL